MPVNTRHRLDKIVIGSSFTVSHIASASSNFNMDVLSISPAGHIAPMSIANLSQNPEITVTTGELDTVLATLPLNGLSTAVDSTLYQKLATDTGTVARVTTSHTKHLISVVTTYWNSISLPHNQEGTMELVVRPVWDGSTDIIIPSASNALLTSLAAGYRYGAGPVSINGTALQGVQNIEVVSGCQIKNTGASSELWPTSVAIQAVAPVVRITTTDIQLLTRDIEGTALNGSTGLVFYGRRFGSADASAHHLKFIGLVGTVHVESESGSNQDDYQCVLRVTLAAGTDLVQPLTYTATTAIT